MEQHQFTFTRQLKAIWRFKRMIILVAMVAAATALISTGMAPPLYTGTITMMIESNPGLAALPAGAEPFAQGIVSQMEIMKSHDVLQRAITQLEPGVADNPQQLEFKITQLRGNLSVVQYSGTSLVGLSVTTTDPLVAQQQVKAIADAYMYQVQATTQTAIETVLDNTTNRMHELITRDVDLSNNPQLTRLSAQFNTALPALQSAQSQLQQMSAGASAPVTEDAGTVLTASQLDMITQHVTDTADEANQLAGLAGQLNPVSEEKDFAFRAASIATIESRMRALATKLGSLQAEVAGMESVEIDQQVQNDLSTAVDQLRIASTTGGAFLNLVISLYDTQGQYRQAVTSDTPNSTQIALYGESDRNMLRRITEHGDLMASSVQAAYDQVSQIVTRPGTLTQWRLQALSKRTGSAITMVEEISQQLLPTSPAAVVLLTQPDIASLEVRGQTVSLTMASLLSELKAAQSEGVSPDVLAGLIGVQDLVSEANVAVGNLGNDITSLAEQESSSLSYTALDQLRQDLLYSLLSLEDSSTSRVVDSGVIAESSDFFTKYKSTVLATIAGLLIGCLIALILQYFDRTARDTSQVSGYLDLPPLAQIARVKYSDNPGGPLSVLTESMYQCLEAFRMLRTNLAIDSKRGQVLLVTSASESEGKTTVAANLARVVGLQGRRVLLIDGNLRKPGLADVFDLKKHEGLSDFLKGTREPWDYITQADGIDIIPAGTPSIASPEMLSSPRMKVLLENAKEIFDVIIVDSAPVMGCTDSRILAREADGVVLVVKSESSKLDLVKGAKEALLAMGAHIVGFVLNKAQSRECKYLPPPRFADQELQDVKTEIPTNAA